MHRHGCYGKIPKTKLKKGEAKRQKVHLVKHENLHHTRSRADAKSNLMEIEMCGKAKVFADAARPEPIAGGCKRA